MAIFNVESVFKLAELWKVALCLRSPPKRLLLFEHYPGNQLNELPKRQNYSGHHQQNLTHQESIVPAREECRTIIIPTSQISQDMSQLLYFEVAPLIFIFMVKYAHYEEEVDTQEEHKKHSVQIEEFTNHFPLHCNIECQYRVTQ